MPLDTIRMSVFARFASRSSVVTGTMVDVFPSTSLTPFHWVSMFSDDTPAVLLVIVTVFAVRVGHAPAAVHVSRWHASEPHAPPAGLSLLAQTPARHVSASEHALTPLPVHAAPSGIVASGGHAPLAPVHVSA